jgi:hypothetical protein
LKSTHVPNVMADLRLKSYEERSIPVPMALIAMLPAGKERSTSLLLFPTSPFHSQPDCGKGNNPDGHFLEHCKEIAFCAGLNRGHCKGEYTVYVLNKGVLNEAKRAYKVRLVSAVQQLVSAQILALCRIPDYAEWDLCHGGARQANQQEHHFLVRQHSA